MADLPDPAPAAEAGTDAGTPEPRVGDEVTLDIGPVAHGGHCVARWDGRVVFVRHALPGERALVRITSTAHAGYFRGDAVEILVADPHRVTPRCVHFAPGGCGGCDFQHADPGLQRVLKGAVVTEQLSRLAGVDRTVTVQALPDVPGAPEGYRWRSRVRWALDDEGRVGPRALRSHEVIGVSAARPCEIAAEGLSETAAVLPVPVGARRTHGRGRERRRPRLPEVALVHRDDENPLVTWSGEEAELIGETVGDRRYAVRGDGFWQVHPAAAGTLSGAVESALDAPLPDGGSLDWTGRTGWDLYGGVGLFAAALADRVGVSGSVVTVENDAEATVLAAQNLVDAPQVTAVTGRVEHLLEDAASALGGDVDVVVLDPPRSGAGKAVCAALAARAPAALVYVACDPAALARDTAILAEHGYLLDSLQAFDCFPQTHHVECVARFLPA